MLTFVKGSPVFGRKRAGRAVVLGAAGLGACVLLAACSPVKMGAAAIVGNQRITAASLDTQVANLQASATRYGSQFPLTAAQMPSAVLSWLVRFSIMDQVAASNGISVSQAQVQQGVATVTSQAASAAAEIGYQSPQEVLVGAGISPQMLTSIGRDAAQETVYMQKANGGQLAATAAQTAAVRAALDTAQCQAAKSLSIQVNPQFGRMDYSHYSVVAGPDTLSRPSGVPSTASAIGLVPAC